MTRLPVGDPLASALAQAIRTGNVSQLKQLLDERPDLATVGLDDEKGVVRSLLHVATDWPGHFPNCGGTIAMLAAAGADVNARFVGSHAETPLHWAASSNDVEALDALLDVGANIDASSGFIPGGTPLTDAVVFAQWNAAHRLVARGARASFAEAAALGLLDQVVQRFKGGPPGQDEIDRAFWFACHGGQRQTAEFLLERGATVNWLPPWEALTPLDAAQRNNFPELVQWLRGRGGEAHGDR